MRAEEINYHTQFHQRQHKRQQTVHGRAQRDIKSGEIDCRRSDKGCQKSKEHPAIGFGCVGGDGVAAFAERRIVIALIHMDPPFHIVCI